MDYHLFILLGSLLAFVHGLTSNMTSQCCGKGKQWFTDSREMCGQYSPSPVPGVPSSQQGWCSAVLEVCCLQEKREKQCQMGVQHARIRGTCEDLRSQRGTEATRQCCHCCKLGLLAKQGGKSCNNLGDLGNDLDGCSGGHCQKVMATCCVGDGETTTVAPTLPPPVATSAGICSRFSGQLCAHKCEDTNEGSSYRCSCFAGFSLHADGRTCIQINAGDRCATNNPCQHLCTDTGIAIICKCFDGFVLQSDGRRCEDIDECALRTHTCTSVQRCRNTPGTYACEGLSFQGTSPPGHNCLTGFAFNPYTQSCEDVDECTIGLSPCSYGQRCQNTQGSFRCLDQGVGDEAPRECGVGFQYNFNSRRCEDIDECNTSSHTCHDPHQMCRNTHGSFLCMCRIGFSFDGRTHQCTDVNECALSRDSCTAGQHCENTIGSYVCRRALNCGTGYTLDKESQRCVDDDECVLGTHNCGVGRECRNIPGSFHCVVKTCPGGYSLNFNNGLCEQVICSRGMRADATGNCIDINECTEQPTVCRANQECRNTIGSYRCRNLVSCGPGFELDPSGSNCIDVNECTKGTHDCTGRLQTCINRRGTYECQCPEGYQMNHRLRMCEDINECERFGGQVCSQNAECQNTEGSFRCMCTEGFQTDATDKSCKDIDECATANRCQHTCRNTWGGFQCSCFDGYQLREDSRTCEDINECEVWQERGGSLCIGFCRNTQGSFECSCPSGYTMMADNRTCRDVDECAAGTANCNGPDDYCINTRGGFKCETVTCPNGFVKAPALGSRGNNVRCQRQAFVCRQGDTECLTAPVSYAVHFITFPSKIRIPADLFTLRGTVNRHKRLEFSLKVNSAVGSGVAPVTRDYFNLKTITPSEVGIQLLRQIEGPQDIELQLDMNIFSNEFQRHNRKEVFFGTAVVKLKIFVTSDIWS